MLILSSQCMAADLPVGLGDMMKKMKGVAEQAKQQTEKPSESTQPVQQAELPPPNTIGGYFARSEQKTKIDNDFGGLFADCVNADADKDSFNAKPQWESYCQSFKLDKRFSNPKDRYATYNHCGQYVSNLRSEVKQRQDSCTQNIATSSSHTDEQKATEPMQTTQTSPDDYKKYLDQKYAKLTSPCTDENQLRTDSNAIYVANNGAMQQCIDLTVNNKVIRTDHIKCYSYSKSKIAEAEKINESCKSELAAKDEEKRVAEMAAEQKAKDDKKQKLKEKYLK